MVLVSDQTSFLVTVMIEKNGCMIFYPNSFNKIFDTLDGANTFNDSEFILLEYVLLFTFNIISAALGMSASAHFALPGSHHW
jgi:hypothetical protein